MVSNTHPTAQMTERQTVSVTKNTRHTTASIVSCFVASITLVFLFCHLCRCIATFILAHAQDLLPSPLLLLHRIMDQASNAPHRMYNCMPISIVPYAAANFITTETVVALQEGNVLQGEARETFLGVITEVCQAGCSVQLSSAGSLG